MRKLRQRSWKRKDCRLGKEIFAVEAVRSISLHEMKDIWYL